MGLLFPKGGSWIGSHSVLFLVSGVFVFSFCCCCFTFLVLLFFTFLVLLLLLFFTSFNIINVLDYKDIGKCLHKGLEIYIRKYVSICKETYTNYAGKWNIYTYIKAQKYTYTHIYKHKKYTYTYIYINTKNIHLHTYI